MTKDMLHRTLVMLAVALGACGPSNEQADASPPGDDAATDVTTFDAPPNDAGADVTDAGDAGDAQAPHPRGIYTTLDIVRDATAITTAEQQSIAVPSVTGVLVRVGWSAIETSDGVFDFSTLESRIGAAKALGKTVELGLIAEGDVPPWFFAPQSAGGLGATGISFSESSHNGAGGKCGIQVTLALPWDSTYLGRFRSMVTAVAADLQAKGLLDTVSVVKLTGLSRSTEELRLPDETPADISCATDAPALWKQAGYTPNKIIKVAWPSLVTSIANAFPGRLYSATILPGAGAFPPFDASGNIVGASDPSVVPITPALVAYAATTLGANNVVVQSDFLLPATPPAAVTLTLASLDGTNVAFQTNELFGTHAACGQGDGGGFVACTPTLYLQELESGIYPNGKNDPLRAAYIEVFPPDAVMFASTLATALVELGQ